MIVGRLPDCLCPVILEVMGQSFNFLFAVSCEHCGVGAEGYGGSIIDV